MPGPEFGRFWGKICGQRWRGMKIEEKQRFLDREAADKIRYQQEYQEWLEFNKEDFEDNEELLEAAEVLVLLVF
uniref:HMG box domain-containing protein n=1 Tax=Panagrolaimus davidi TaxID=227884 RepID=A0A914Q9R5_9BILA